MRPREFARLIRPDNDGNLIIYLPPGKGNCAIAWKIPLIPTSIPEITWEGQNETNQILSKEFNPEIKNYFNYNVLFMPVSHYECRG
jgi:hypothetical protein